MRTRSLRLAALSSLLLGSGLLVGLGACGSDAPSTPPADAAVPVPTGTAPPPSDAEPPPPVDASPGVDAGCGSDVPRAPGVLHTEYGAVRGALDGPIYAYKNIPYAAPPVGKLRWAAPQAPACWTGARDGVAWGPQCLQGNVEGDGTSTGVEDCLQLNVWTPNGAKDRPILFWIHGGGNQVGSAVQENDGARVYDGRRLAETTNSVVVTVNYRLGMLGFLGHSALAAEGGGTGGTGNYGLQDLAAAVAWAKRHAAALGGDPARLMVFGESAGGLNVCSLLAAKSPVGFSAAAIQSGGCAARTLADAQEQGVAVVAAAKCDADPDVLACLRGLAGADLLKAYPTSVNVAGAGNGWGATVDNSFLDQKPLDVIASGRHAKVPVVIGANANETSRSVPLRFAATDAEYRAAVQTLFGATFGPTVLARYPSASYPSPWAAFVALTSQAKFICPSRRIAKALTTAGSPAYRYYFDHPLDNSPILKAFGTFHGVDVAYMFGKLDVGGYTPSEVEKDLSRAFMLYWSTHAATGAPGGAGLTAWPKYDPAKDNSLGIGTTTAVREGLHQPNCDFWDALQ
ncbi:MAG TPA: carboxylesterase family protein [Polyangiaceae bacterium]|nr:carboxylesterase family protein [Polyangiaceae bacterium]